MNSIRQAVARHARRGFASAAPAAENPMWRSIYRQTPIFVAFILSGAIVVEVVFGKFTKLVWRGANRGVSC